MLNKLPHTLEELDINIPASDGFVVKFTNFTKLKRLGIYDVNRLSKFNIIANDTFKPLENSTIEELRIKVPGSKCGGTFGVLSFLAANNTGHEWDNRDVHC